ncbi:fec operon regulator FecR [compost metagenome]
MSGTAQNLDLDTLEAAARWYVDLREGSPSAGLLAAHREWLACDPRNRQAWDRVERLEHKFGQIAGVGRSTLGNARAKRRSMLKVLAVLLTAGGSGLLAWREPHLRATLADVHTATGERRSLRLDDGSQLELNTATAVDIRFGPQMREVRLLSGEILVQTAKDPAGRPFVVHTAQGSVRALGTRFIVRSDERSCRVGVQEHAVEIRPAMAPDRPVRVGAGQGLRFSASEIDAVRPLPAAADAWTRDMLIVDDWSLGDFLAELGRYRPGHLRCDPAVANLRISGGFHLGNTDTVLDNLAQTLPLRIRRFTRYWVSVEAQGSS